LDQDVLDEESHSPDANSKRPSRPVSVSVLSSYWTPH
jgi:hypothetical protein